MFTCLIVYCIWELGKLRFDNLEKDDYADCKFICGVIDEGIMKSDRLEWGLVTM